MPDVVFAIPGDLASSTGGYAYDRRVMARLPEHGLTVRHLPLPGSFPHPSPHDLIVTERALASVGPDAVILFDGLAFSALPVEMVRAIRQPVVAIVHHPLSFEPGLSEQRRRELQASERAALTFAKVVIVSSATTKTVLGADFGVSADRIAVAVPGTAQAKRARGSGAVPSILSVGAISPRKGYGVLIDAFSYIAHLPWHAIITGTTERDPATGTLLAAAIEAHKLSDRITLAGEVTDERLAELYDGADLFVSASLYEGYGMVLAEAMAHGLPIVSTTRGASAETVPDGAALKVPPNDTQALASAIARLLQDPALRITIADASWRAGQMLPTWDQATAIVAQAIRDAA